jgi:hypothetical protein
MTQDFEMSIVRGKAHWITSLESQWTDRNHSTIEGLLGAHEEELAGVTRYLLVTDQREIRLDSRRTAVVHSAPF